MEFPSNKCSSKKHKDEVDAIKYCPECKKLFCKKCDEFHGSIFEDHQTYPLDKDMNEIFTGFCKLENHQSELNYFCKDHNELVCAKCTTKMKGQGNGQHTDCNICYIGDICEEKKKKLADNIKDLENLSKLFQESIEVIKQISEKIDENKEEIKKEIATIFTKIRVELNNREDELLNKVDKIYEKKIFNQNIDIVKDRKYPEKIKSFIEKGKLVEKEWDKNNNKNSLVNDCINIEKTIDKIKKLNKNIEGYRIKNKKLKFYNDSQDLISLIKREGSFNDNNLNQQEINMDIDDFNPQSLSFKKQICNNYGNPNNYCYDGVCFFISRNDEYVLGYVDSSNTSIIFYDINNDKELKKFGNAHDGQSIYCIKYYNYSEYDMILSSSTYSYVKIWNFNESKKIIQISSLFYYSSSYYGVYSSCVIFDKNNFNIFSVTADYGDYIKMYNSENQSTQNIANNNYSRYYIDSCEIDEKKYLIVCGYPGVEVYDYPGFNQYHYFRDNNESQNHCYAKIVESNNGYNLIDAGQFNTIKIWDFVNKNLISTIKSDSGNNLQGFVVINNKYLFIGSNDKSIKEFDIENIENKTHIKNFNKHTSTVLGLKPAKDKNDNIYILSYGLDKNIFLWGFK